MTFQDFWDYTLIRTSDVHITVRIVVLAIVLVVVGFVFSRLVSRGLARLLGRRLRLEIGAVAAIEALGFYVLFISFVVTSLTLAQFPLTIFTIAGGAVAIGVGFGSQTIMNNFISGLILHMERPIRSGDLVEVEGTHGVIERIGARSTRIRASDNTNIIVPNSFFLENKVVNFTLSDDIIRTQVRVGVVYGSPTEDVQRIIRRVLEENPRVLAEPEPKIIFADFGDNALQFDAYFWIRARMIMDRRQVESDVRFQLDTRFREAGIVIAFPQRDVHLDAAAPLSVRLVGSDGTGAAGPR